MRRLVASAIALASFATAHTAQACLYTQRPEDVGHASGEYFAREMLDQAEYVDLVLVESEGVANSDGRPSNFVTLRTIARFKGASADRFTVFGNLLTFGPEADRIFAAPLQHFTSDTGQVTPFPYVEEWEARLLPVDRDAPPPPPLAISSCSPPAINAVMGRFYVVMRDGEGRVLDRVSLSDGQSTAPNHPAFSFVPVTLSDDDFWLNAVRLASARSDGTSSPHLLYLRGGSDPVEVERTLGSAGVTVRAAYYDRDGFVEEVRPSPDEQTRPWLAKARPFVETSTRQRSTLAEHGAAEFLRSNLSQMRRYDSSLAYELAQAFTASISDHGQGDGSPRLIAIELDEDPQMFAGLDFVERVAPLSVRLDRLPQVTGANESESFQKMQRIEHAIWLMNGGAGNQQGTLP